MSCANNLLQMTLPAVGYFSIFLSHIIWVVWSRLGARRGAAGKASEQGRYATQFITQQPTK